MLMPFILAQRVLDLFEESGATSAERDAALDVVEAIIRRNRIDGDALFPLVTDRFSSPDDEDVS